MPLPEPDGRPEILVLRAIKLGDLLVAVPAFHAIHRARPDARILLATTGWLAPLVELIDGVDVHLPQHGLDHAIAVEPGRVGTVVDLHGNRPLSTDLLDALQPEERIGYRWEPDGKPHWDGPEWVDGIHERDRWAAVPTWHGMAADPNEVWINSPGPSANPGAAVVHVGAAYGSRYWPSDRFATVAHRLEQDGLRVVLTGGESERNRALQVAEAAGLSDDRVLAGRAGLREFAATIADARVLVTVDTGAAHLASAFRTPSVVLFGPSPVEEWGPPPGPHLVLTDASLRVGDSFGSEPDPALLAVTAADVLAGVAQLLLSPDH